MTDLESTARALAALGHEARLTIFRTLVRAGRTGLSIGEIATHTGLAASTQAHHLKMLVDAGLVQQKRQGRETINTAHFQGMDAVISYLTDECCAGFDTATKDAALEGLKP